MFLPLWRYFDFSGRSRRREFWMFFLLSCVVLAGIAFWVFRILVMIGSEGNSGHVVDDAAGYLNGPIAAVGILVLVTFVPSIAVQVRRFHDQDRTGWLVLLNLVPCVGSLVVLALMCLEGTDGDNRYGPDPRAA